ncbi:hypothetical protein LTR27_000703 [Elasticomyces elasticus]|nr:hypothetical protein LTR27_000703 [Elasticomyces elasticus]
MDGDQDDRHERRTSSGSTKRGAARFDASKAKKPRNQLRNTRKVAATSTDAATTTPASRGSTKASRKSTAQPIPVTLDPIEVPPNSMTININRWIEATKDGKMQLTGPTPAFKISCVPSLKQREEKQAAIALKQQIMSSDMPAVHYSKAPVRDGRAFKVVRVRQVHVPVEALDDIYVWAIDVQNSNALGEESTTLFGRYKEPRLGSQVKPNFGGALEKHVCGSAKDAEELGACACGILDCLPFSLESPVSEYWQRYVEILALETWRPDFDFTMLDSPYWEVPNPENFRNFFPSSIKD